MSVTTTIDAAVALVTMESANGLNVADVATMTALRAELLELAGNPEVRAVVLTGAGDRAFCAGADIKYMSSVDEDGAAAWARLGQEVAHLLETMPQVTIAAVNGLALGGGCELALACDLRYASPSARFGQPEINLGIVPGWGGTQRLARATTIGFAKELILTGRVVDAEEAYARGLVDAVHDPVLEKALETAKLVAVKSGVALAAAKQLCNEALQDDLDASLQREGAKLAELIAGEDGREGLAAFLEKREPRFQQTRVP
jgi:enoyl-CoA hydratase